MNIRLLILGIKIKALKSNTELRCSHIRQS